MAASARQRRSAARLAAIQALYALEISGDDVTRVVADFLDRPWSPAEEAPDYARPDEAFLRTLVEGVQAGRSDLDRAIEDALTGSWSLSRLEIVLRAILRAGAYELAAEPDVPAKVIINEYLEIAHAFFAGKEPSLVNAVLDRLAGHYRRLEGGLGGKGSSNA